MIESLLNISAFSVIKVAVLIFLFIYFLFAIIVSRQISLMSETLDVEFDNVIKFISTLHLFVSIAVFFLGIAIL